jgi:hypothetical protein
MRAPRAALLAGALALAATSGTSEGASSGAFPEETEVSVATADADRPVTAPLLRDREVEIEVTLVPGRVRHLADAPCAPAC